MPRHAPNRDFPRCPERPARSRRRCPKATRAPSLRGHQPPAASAPQALVPPPPRTCSPARSCQFLPSTVGGCPILPTRSVGRSEEHTSELQSLAYLVCRLLLEKKKKKKSIPHQMT